MQAECPHCRADNAVSESAFGCYVPCVRCGCKFYVPVPPLEESGPTASRPFEPATPRSAVEVTPRGVVEATAHPHSNGRVLMRQEALLATINDELAALRQRVTICCAALVIAILVSSLLNALLQ